MSCHRRADAALRHLGATAAELGPGHRRSAAQTTLAGAKRAWAASRRTLAQVPAATVSPQTGQALWLAARLTAALAGQPDDLGSQRPHFRRDGALAYMGLYLAAHQEHCPRCGAFCRADGTCANPNCQAAAPDAPPATVAAQAQRLFADLARRQETGASLDAVWAAALPTLQSLWQQWPGRAVAGAGDQAADNAATPPPRRVIRRGGPPPTVLAPSPPPAAGSTAPPYRVLVPAGQQPAHGIVVITDREHALGLERVVLAQDLGAYAVDLADHAPRTKLSAAAAAQMVAAAYQDAAGVYIPGGADIDPAYYGEKRNGTGYTEPQRDALEMALVRRTLQEGTKPLCGICRGHQMICAAEGGTLYQDLPRQYPQPPDPSARVQHGGGYHRVWVAPDSRLAAILGKTELRVNSLHHQAVRDVPPGWRAVAWADDGVIEAIEQVEPHGAPVISVQWHPEMMYGDQEADRLLAWWAQQIAASAGSSP